MHIVNAEELKKLQWKETRTKWENLFEQQLKIYNVKSWKTQFRFDKNRRWRTDFAWPDHWVLVEIEGGIWSRGRHSRPSGVIKDLEKYTRAAELGYRLFRFVGEDLKNLKAVEMMVRVVGTVGGRLE